MPITNFKPQRIATEGEQKAPVKNPEVLKHLEAGQLLFAQGDAGGDLFFIESGIIEIFITKNGQDIVLAQMGPGEVIGVMTLLTREPRLAAARARDKSSLKKISRMSVTKLIATLPKWLHIVLKEFTIRINEMNRRYSETLLELKTARENQVTTLFLGTQMARGLPSLAVYFAKDINGNKTVSVEELLEKMEHILNQPREMIAGIWEIYEDCKLVKLEPGSDKRKKFVSVSTLVKLGEFAKFMNETNSGFAKKVVKSRLNFKEILTINTLVKFVIEKGADASKLGEFVASDIEASFEKKTGIGWNFSHCDKLIKLSLITIKGDDANKCLVFTPAELERTMSHVSAMKKLLGEFSEEGPAESSANSESSAQAAPASAEAPKAS